MFPARGGPRPTSKKFLLAMIIPAADFQKIKKMINVCKTNILVTIQKNEYISFEAGSENVTGNKLEFGQLTYYPANSEEDGEEEEDIQNENEDGDDEEEEEENDEEDEVEENGEEVEENEEGDEELTVEKWLRRLPPSASLQFHHDAH